MADNPDDITVHNPGFLFRGRLDSRHVGDLHFMYLLPAGGGPEVILGAIRNEFIFNSTENMKAFNELMGKVADLIDVRLYGQRTS